MKGTAPPSADTTTPQAKRRLWQPAPSLNPSQTMIEACAERVPHPYATAIRNCWQFRAPVKVLSADEYKRLVERCTITFSR